MYVWKSECLSLDHLHANKHIDKATHTHKHVRKSTYTNKSISIISFEMQKHTLHINMHIYIHAFMCMWMYVCMFCVCAHKYALTCRYRKTHMHIYKHIHIGTYNRTKKCIANTTLQTHTCTLPLGCNIQWT